MPTMKILHIKYNLFLKYILNPSIAMEIRLLDINLKTLNFFSTAIMLGFFLYFKTLFQKLFID